MGFNGDTMGNVMIYSIKHVYLVVLELENQHVQKGKQCYILFHITGCILQNYVRLAKGTASLSYMQKKHIYLSIHRLYLQEDIDPLVQATKLELYANNLENEGT